MRSGRRSPPVPISDDPAPGMSSAHPTPALPGPSPQRLLFIAEGQLGDLLLLTPALRAVKESFPASHLTVLVLQRRFYTGGSDKGLDFPIVRSSQGGTSVVLTNGHVR